ncbi:hypothetical protein E2C01_025933 [Portunus trituberculatus]|uniref:Uncharacterized protein n=1 Tax=Portunus trituberculatus TaxID=210409 RepID=A0A5B7EJB1_PORTR|nr:hypothetical protein [Portunus trituberculatus]
MRKFIILFRSSVDRDVLGETEIFFGIEEQHPRKERLDQVPSPSGPKAFFVWILLEVSVDMETSSLNYYLTSRPDGARFSCRMTAQPASEGTGYAYRERESVSVKDIMMSVHSIKKLRVLIILK